MTFQRTGWRLAAWYATEAFFWTLAAVSFLAVLLGLYEIHPLGLEEAAFFFVLIVVLVWVPASYAWNLGRWIRRVRTYYLRLDGTGLEFHLPGRERMRLSWQEIRALTSEKRWVKLPGIFYAGAYKNIFYTIETARGRFTFSQMEIPSAKRAAKEIAARLNGGDPTVTAAGSRNPATLPG